MIKVHLDEKSFKSVLEDLDKKIPRVSLSHFMLFILEMKSSPELRSKLLSGFNIKRLISISNVGTCKFEDQGLIPQ